jgi:hypothetical protein
MKKQSIILFFLALSVCTHYKGFAQVDCSDATLIPLPAMYVYKSIANERMVEFSSFPNSKFEILKNVNGKQDLYLIYTRNAIDNLLREINKEYGIRVYFARYARYEGSPLPKEIEDCSLVLLFATEFKDSSKPKEYFFLNHKANDDNLYKVLPKDAEEWIIDYNINVQRELRKGLIANDKDNLDPYDNRGIYYDTKSIFYSKENIDAAFKDEVIYQRNKHGIDINAYKLSFSSYTAGGDENEHFKNRLLLQFDYLYGSNKILDLEKQDEFACRDSLRVEKFNRSVNKAGAKKAVVKSQKMLSKELSKTLFALDNGQLCPTNCPK